MTIEDLRSQLEMEVAWREDELRHLRNALSLTSIKEPHISAGRTLIVMTYAHFEGFVKAALSLYARAINEERIVVGKLKAAIGAATMLGELDLLRNPPMEMDGKDEISRAARRKLRQAEREAEFVLRVREMQEVVGVVPIDRVVSTDSNLSPAVLRRNLFRLGLNPEEFTSYEATVGFLLRTRNDVAHGRKTEEVPPKLIEKVTGDVRNLMSEMVKLIYRSARDGEFRLVAPGET